MGVGEEEPFGMGQNGSPGWIRTSDHSINSRMLYR